MTKEFFEACMRVPTCSGHEDMMIEFLMDWGKEHGCRTTKDAKGNVYMEKGSAKHPVGCVNHTDTVHTDQKEMVEQKVFKEIVWKGDRVEAVNPLTKKQTGLGMDDQGGCVIALAVIDALPAIKAMFPVEEEVGCQGTHASKYKEFFKDCSFVFSNDSPDRNRATHYSSGTQMYSDGFFEEFIGPVFKKHGVTSFRSEPWTDSRWVRLDVKGEDGKNIEVINAGNGGYNAHTDSEYAVFSEVNAAEEMMIDLCKAVGTEKQYTSDIKEEPRPSFSWSGSSSYGSYGSWSPWASRRRSSSSTDPNQTGSFVWAFNSEKIRDRYVGRMGPRFSSVGLEKVGRQSVKVSGRRMFLKSAYMFAFNYDNGTSYTSWADFETYDSTAASMFDDDFKADRPDSPSSAGDPSAGHGNYDECAVYVAIEAEEDAGAVEATIYEAELPVDVERQGDGLSISGPLVSVQRAFAIACDVMNGTRCRFFANLGRVEKDEFWKSVVFDENLDDASQAIDVDYKVVEPEKDVVKGDDLWAMIDRKNSESRARAAKAGGASGRAPRAGAQASDDLFRGHSPDDECRMELRIGFRPGFRDELASALNAENLSVFEFQDKFVISGRLEDVMQGCVSYINVFFNKSKYAKFQDFEPQKKDNFWNAVKF